MITITIDCGASFIKGAAFADGKPIRMMSCASPAVHGTQSVFVPQQIQPLVQVVRQMIVELAGGNQTVELSISNEMHGFILAYKDGEPYTDYISWQKEYGSVPVEGISSVQLLKNRDELQEDIRYTGMPLRGGLPSCNLLYLYRSGQMAGRKGQLHFYTLGSYLLKVLSGEEPVEHPTNAAATGIYDLRTSDWNWKYIEHICNSEIRFPKVGQGRMKFDLDGVRIYALPAIGDQQAALLGAGFIQDTDISFNLGTGAQVSCLTKTLSCGSECQIRPYFDGKYLKTIPHIPSGRALNVYFRLIQSVLVQYGVVLDEDKIWSGIVGAASTGASDLKVDLSFFENAITSCTKGSITQIEEYSLTMGNLMRSALQTMTENFVGAAECIAPDDSKIKRLIFSGGVARKFDLIRTGIFARYPEAEVLIASNETLVGLYQYAKMKENLGVLP